MGKPRILNLEQFARERGLLTTADVQGHIHAGLRSKPTTKTYQRWYDQRLAELQVARDQTVALYRAEIEAGNIRPPSPRRLEEIAAGDPEKESTQAAIRLLAKRTALAADRRTP